MSEVSAAQADRTLDPLIRRDLRERGRVGRLADIVQVIESGAGGALVGGLGPPSAERVRLVPHLSLAFPTGELAGVQEQPDGRWRIEAACLGLYGQSSPLPTFFTERLFDEHYDGDGRVRDFLDVFNHRLLSLLVRALGKHRPMAGSQRIAVTAVAGGAAQHHTHLLAGLLARRPASAAALAAALGAWLPGIAVRIEPCAAAWTDLPAEARARMGTPMGGALGSRMRACSTAFRVHLGPLDASALIDLLPGGPGHARLAAVVHDFNPTGLTCLVRLTTAPGAMPVARLGSAAGFGGALGRTTRCDGADPGHVIDYTLTNVPAARGSGNAGEDGSAAPRSGLTGGYLPPERASGAPPRSQQLRTPA